jgi:aspartate kinase
MRARIPVRVLNTNRPDHPGTVIQELGPENPNAVTSIAYKERQLVLTVTSMRMLGESGFLARVFETCARHEVVVDLVCTSEVSISLTGHERGPMERAAAELGQTGDVELRGGRTILAVVGRHLSERVGLGAAVLSAVAEAGVNVDMVSYAAGAINLSMVIADEDIDRAVASLHGVLFPC